MDGYCGCALEQFDHEHVEVLRDRDAGLLCVIAVHSTALGPAMGGVRRTEYPSIDAAMSDALRLSAAMTVKSSLAGLPLGGGKSVIVQQADDVRPQTLDAFAAELERLAGRYVAAEDLGTGPADMDRIASRTRWVAGASPELGGSGDPSPATAQTVLGAIEHAHRLHLGSDSLQGARVGVLGVGKVGARLAQLLAEAGAELVLSDVDDARAAHLAAALDGRAVPVDELAGQKLDVLAPCARGGYLDAETVESLRAKVVCGAANNVLADPALARRLADAGVLYVPDFMANAGGIIQVGGEFLHWSQERIEQAIARSIDLSGEILQQAISTGALPLDLAMERALARVRAAERPVPSPDAQPAAAQAASTVAKISSTAAGAPTLRALPGAGGAKKVEAA